jgi:hypothetical protein
MCKTFSVFIPYNFMISPLNFLFENFGLFEKYAFLLKQIHRINKVSIPMWCYKDCYTKWNVQMGAGELKSLETKLLDCSFNEWSE